MGSGQAHHSLADDARRLASIAVSRAAALDPERAAPPTDADRIRLHEQHWAGRQLQLYDLGGLERFVRSRGKGELLERADDLTAWVDAPMGGFRLIDANSRVLRWLDLATDTGRITPNLGGGVMVGLGNYAIGRLVPTGEGEIFESRPQPVDRVTAEQVAAFPEQWLEVLRAAFVRCAEHYDDQDAGRITVDPDHDDFEGLADLGRHEPDLLTDTVTVSWMYALLQDAAPGTSIQSLGSTHLGAAVLRTARRLLSGTPDPETPDWAMPGPERWACLSAALTRPPVYNERARLTVSDSLLFSDLAGTLPEPAASVCRLLSVRDQEVA